MTIDKFLDHKFRGDSGATKIFHVDSNGIFKWQS